MSYIDLHNTLREWPYDVDQISVRKIMGIDGVVRIQMRVELGVLQMEADGRPDGARPNGHESLLQMYQADLDEHMTRNGNSLGFALSPEECGALRLEASQYYRRYVAYFVLEEYDEVVRDAAHNLAILDMCNKYAIEAEDRLALESYRPYIIMMATRGRAYHALAEGELPSALAHIKRGILDIRTHFESHESPEALENCEELRVLRDFAVDIQDRMPNDSLVGARNALRTAIEQERFEEAAKLRDTLKKLYPESEPNVP